MSPAARLRSTAGPPAQGAYFAFAASFSAESASDASPFRTVLHLAANFFHRRVLRRLLGGSQRPWRVSDLLADHLREFLVELVLLLAETLSPSPCRRRSTRSALSRLVRRRSRRHPPTLCRGPTSAFPTAFWWTPTSRGSSPCPSNPSCKTCLPSSPSRTSCPRPRAVSVWPRRPGVVVAGVPPEASPPARSGREQEEKSEESFHSGREGSA